MGEMEKRKRTSNKKMKRAGLLILIGITCCLLSLFVPGLIRQAGYDSKLVDLLELSLACGYCVCGLLGVMKFVSSLHDPLTEEEAKELVQFDKLEKTGER